MIYLRRFLFSAILLLGTFFVPWFVGIAAAFILAWMFRRYVELVGVGIIIDLTTGSPETLAGGYVFTLATILLLITIEFLKTRMWYYQ